MVNTKSEYSGKLFFFFLMLSFLPLSGFSQGEEQYNGAFFPPDSVRRPHREEAPRYPQDLVIGELGRGRAPQAAWLYAQDVLTAFIRSNRSSPVFSSVDNSLYNRISGEIAAIKPEKFRIGGGRIEADGAVSFLIRFLGQEQSITGELYLYQESGEENTGPWHIDDFLLEESRNLLDLRESSRSDFTAYERLY